jgi:hypothetical protein
MVPQKGLATSTQYSVSIRYTWFFPEKIPLYLQVLYPCTEIRNFSNSSCRLHSDHIRLILIWFPRPRRLVLMTHSISGLRFSRNEGLLSVSRFLLFSYPVRILGLAVLPPLSQCPAIPNHVREYQVYWLMLTLAPGTQLDPCVLSILYYLHIEFTSRLAVYPPVDSRLAILRLSDSRLVIPGSVRDYLTYWLLITSASGTWLGRWVLLIHIIFILLTPSFWPYLAFPFLSLAFCLPLGPSGHTGSGLHHHPVLYCLSGPIPTSHSTIHYWYLTYAHPSCLPTLCESPCMSGSTSGHTSHMWLVQVQLWCQVIGILWHYVSLSISVHSFVYMIPYAHLFHI